MDADDTRWSGGSIPACAGEPFARAAILKAAAVYPRVCGGTRVLGRQVGAGSGLSPRVRGNPGRRLPENPGRRSIPACAGEPLLEPDIATGTAVYPRVCGGTQTTGVPVYASSGLSPRVRGNHAAGSVVILCSGSIPACAGEPPPDWPRFPASGVYPRVCGGTAGRQQQATSPAGLSPRVRGNRNAYEKPPTPNRSIPACAGEPGLTGWGTGLSGVYPRVCGGTAGTETTLAPPAGLSPRVRGNPLGTGAGETAAGSIPACAGEPHCEDILFGCERVYPRVCGGTPVDGGGQ